jgi:predicted O-methyltransferase YrrM
MITMNIIKELLNKVPEMVISGHPFLDQRWTSDGHDNRNKHYRRPYYRFCQALVKLTTPKLIVELGIDEGDCSGHLANGCKTATVLGVDVHKDWEYPSQRCREVEKQFSNFKYLRGWTWDKVSEVKTYGPIDILFIDSWHQFDYLAKDWNDYAPLLNDNSIVLIDDLQMDRIGEAFTMIPAQESYIDRSMNSQIPFGILINPDRTYKFKHNKMDFMP